jgi:exodeoxyribonuclease VII small subunit
MTAKSQSSQSNAGLSFEACLTELEAIVGQMESANLPLEQSLNAYKRGAELLQICQKSLANAEQQVRILTETNKLAAFNSNDE